MIDIDIFEKISDLYSDIYELNKCYCDNCEDFNRISYDSCEDCSIQCNIDIFTKEIKELEKNI